LAPIEPRLKRDPKARGPRLAAANFAGDIDTGPGGRDDRRRETHRAAINALEKTLKAPEVCG
jgi:hypothetical protein